YRDAAVRAARAILAGLRTPAGRLKRSWKDGRATGEGVLEDYSHLGEGLLALYEATFDERWFFAAREFADAILGHFSDPAGGFFDTADDHERLVTRPKDPQDNAVPSGGSEATMLLLRLAALTGEARYRTAADQAIASVTALAPGHATGFANWLSAIDFALAPVVEIAVVGDAAADETSRLLAPARTGYRPNQVLAISADPVSSAVPLLGGRFAIDGRPTAFVCRDFACRQPVNEPEALAALLSDVGP
ncbi:MAG: thioredoxin domain-containing protein, partial [Chloroflexota bacterium]|nr:thioredoxin domain-containing protein [Chloroflexota bacterium]